MLRAVVSTIVSVMSPDSGLSHNYDDNNHYNYDYHHNSPMAARRGFPHRACCLPGRRPVLGPPPHSTYPWHFLSAILGSYRPRSLFNVFACTLGPGEVYLALSCWCPVHTSQFGFEAGRLYDQLFKCDATFVSFIPYVQAFPFVCIGVQVPRVVVCVGRVFGCPGLSWQYPCTYVLVRVVPVARYAVLLT